MPYQERAPLSIRYTSHLEEVSMSELQNKEEATITTKLAVYKLPATPPASDVPVVDRSSDNTPMLAPVASVAETPLSPPKPEVVNKTPKQTPRKQVNRGRSRPLSKLEAASAHMLRERCRQLCLSTFFREHVPACSLGFTSSVGGEGKSFLATVTAEVLANDSSTPVTLLECNWEHPSIHQYFGLPSSPGLAEWLRKECSEEAIRHKVDRNLTIIPAGDGRRDAVKLLQQIREKGLLDTLDHANDLLIVDLPAIVTTAYGSLAASLVESLVIVVRAGVTPDGLIAETCSQLKDLPVQGVILNQLESHIPRWIRRIL